MPRDLFIAKLPLSVSTDELKELFEEVGPVVFITRPVDPTTGSVRSFAFALMESEEDGQIVIERFNGHEFDGQAIVVRQSDKPVTMPRHLRDVHQTPVTPARQDPPQSVFDWEARYHILEELVAHPGQATSLKMTVVGQPDAIHIGADVVILLLQHFSRTTGFPRGVPVPPPTPTLVAAYISQRQWERVALALSANAQDKVILEGQPIFDADIPGIALLVTLVTTQDLQASNRSQVN